MLEKIKGYLTKKDMELLDDATTRTKKYNTASRHGSQCKDCNFNAWYVMIRCVVCSSKNLKLVMLNVVK